MIVSLDPKLQALCDEYERHRGELVAGDATKAIPPILTVVLAVVPLVIRLIRGGSLDIAVIRQIIDSVLPFIGVPPELLELAKQIIDMLIEGFN